MYLFYEFFFMTYEAISFEIELNFRSELYLFPTFNSSYVD